MNHSTANTGEKALDEKQKTKAGELAAAATRVLFGTLGAVNPHLALVAPLMGEVITGIIPRQRINRVERLTAELAAQVSGMDEERVRARFGEPGFVDLLEDGLGQTIRATSEERIKQIATLLKNGLSDDDVNALQYKKLMSLLHQINDAEVIILQSAQEQTECNPMAFYEKHKTILTPPVITTDRPQNEVDEMAIYTSYLAQLITLGLLKNEYKFASPSTAPQSDIIMERYKERLLQITPLGNLLVRAITP